MNKKELTSVVAEKVGLSKNTASLAVEAVLETIAESLEKGEKVQLVGFGSFETRKRDARQARNPRTGEVAEIAAAMVPVFKAGKPLKERTNQQAGSLAKVNQSDCQR